MDRVSRALRLATWLMVAGYVGWRFRQQVHETLEKLVREARLHPQELDRVLASWVAREGQTPEKVDHAQVLENIWIRQETGAHPWPGYPNQPRPTSDEGGRV